MATYGHVPSALRWLWRSSAGMPRTVSLEGVPALGHALQGFCFWRSGTPSAAKAGVFWRSGTPSAAKAGRSPTRTYMVRKGEVMGPLGINWGSIKDNLGMTWGSSWSHY